MIKTTTPDVFIIESLDFQDEVKQRFEGKFLSEILRFDGKNPIYYYIRTRREFEAVLLKFQKSNYRYLHISCHGNTGSLFTTLDALPFSELSTIINEVVEKKRVFISACSAVNDHLARIIIPKSRCYSIVGPLTDVYFGHAAIVWASFYHLMFEASNKRMKRHQLLKTLNALVELFGVPLNYYSISNHSKAGYKLTKITNNLL